MAISLSVIKNLVRVSDKLNTKGAVKEAEVVDQLIKKAQYVYGPITEHTRYCPAHHGVMMARIDENVYQCPVDSKKYDFQAGFKVDQKEYPGGSVAEQTPDNSEWYTSPHPIFKEK